jgi:GNAT superfamily N-acetyltransferase
MPDYSISEARELTRTDVVGLYTSVGWSTYASDPESLVRAIDQSSYVVAARDGTGQLIGLARAISDDVSICFIQDVLVRPGRQRSGIGRALVDRILERYRHVRRKVLITDAESGQRAFYESRGFTEVHDFEPSPLRAFVRFGVQ